jgi:HSP20 family protein
VGHEPGGQRLQVLISLDYLSRRQEARLLLYPCAETEIAQPPSRRRRLNFGANETYAAAMVPNSSKKSTAFLRLEDAVMTNKTGTAMAPMKALRELMGFDPFRRFPERFFEGFDPFMRFGGENWSLGAWAPACDIYENNNEIVVKVELPEVKMEDVIVSIENNILTIHGERKLSEETKRENYHRVERNYGEFTRSFTLPGFVDTNKVNAEFKDGILRVTLGKREEARPKNVEVKVK